MKQIVVTKDNLSEVYLAIGQYIADNKGDKMMIEMRKYDKQREISKKQMDYIHCEDGPIAKYAAKFYYSHEEAELYLKRECGEHLFICELTGETWFGMCKVKSVGYFECKSPLCKKLIHKENIRCKDGKRVCPKCGTEARVIAIASKTELTTKQCKEWIDSMFTFLTEKGVDVKPPMKPNERK